MARARPRRTVRRPSWSTCCSGTSTAPTTSRRSSPAMVPESTMMGKNRQNRKAKPGSPNMHPLDLSASGHRARRRALNRRRRADSCRE
uniref:Uncharacterized protein n=1 Tax=Arundo donax TaxID=35708 RepID=A0A0A9EZ42_ARUDO